MAIDNHDNIWLGTNLDGVSKFDGTNWTTYTVSNGLADNGVLAIAADAKGNKWFGTRGGVSKFDDKNWTTYTTLNGLADDMVHSIAIDAQGNKWFGTSEGVSKFDSTRWTTYSTSDSLEYLTAHAIAIDAQGNIWFGTQHNGIAKLSANEPGLISKVQKLNQVELMKQFLGTWKCELGKDTSMIVENTLFEIGMESNRQIVTKGKIISRGKSLWEYDKKDDRFIISGISTSSPDTVRQVLWFTSKNTCSQILFKDITNPQNAVLKWKTEFISPNQRLVHVTKNNSWVALIRYTR
jgi:ligand-binding sensor domain-containing protein